MHKKKENARGKIDKCLFSLIKNVRILINTELTKVPVQCGKTFVFNKKFKGLIFNR